MTSIQAGAAPLTNDIHHVLLTRFNLNYGNSFPYSEEWMAHRMDLFTRYCLPSVQRQKNQNFQWLIFFDAERSLHWKPQIEAFSSAANIRVEYITKPPEMSAIIALEAPASGLLLTSRLDNDDMLHPAYTQDLQNHVMQQSQMLDFPTVLDFPKTTWWPENSRVAQQYRSPIVTPFATLAEKLGDEVPQTVLAAHHAALADKFGPVQSLPGARTLTVLHDLNISNGRSRFGKLSQLAKRILKHKTYLRRSDVDALLDDFSVSSHQQVN